VDLAKEEAKEVEKVAMPRTRNHPAESYPRSGLAAVAVVTLVIQTTTMGHLFRLPQLRHTVTRRHSHHRQRCA
jgi:hypothetical protein